MSTSSASCDSDRCRRFDHVTAWRVGLSVVVDWACDFCGEWGSVRLPAGDTVDSLQCVSCGEPVTLVAEHPRPPIF